MKNASDGSSRRRGADGLNVPQNAASWSPLTFRIVVLVRCSRGDKQAMGTIDIDGFGELDIDYVRPLNGRESFVSARSTRCKFTDVWVRGARISDDLAVELLTSVEARLAADVDGDHAG